MKKILYLIPHLQNQGPVIQLLSLVEQIDRVEYEVIIATIFPERENSLLDKFKTLDVKIVCGTAKRWQLWVQKEIIKKVIRKFEPDIVHSCSVITDGICASICIPAFLVITLHNNIYEDVIVRYGKFLGGYLVKKEKIAITKAKYVVTCSETLFTQYTKLIPREYISIPNGIDCQKWREMPLMPVEELKSNLALPADKFIVVSTGSLIKRKNPMVVISAFKNLGLSNAVLVVLGDGELMSKCENIANKDVIFKGRVNNVKEYLYASDLLISASSAEGLPYAILEAECTGIRMILSDIPQHREALGNNTKFVRFFQVNNQRELGQLMKIEIESGKSRIEYDLKNISVETMARRYMEIYKKCEL